MTIVAAPVFAQTSGLMAQAPVPQAKSGFECVQAAVDTREAPVGTAFTTFSTAESAALSARKTALHDAWGMTVAQTTEKPASAPVVVVIPPTVRNVPDSVRYAVFAEYGIDYSLHSNYEVDHLISLELGGSNDIADL